jgi:hypothetical protein
MDHGTKSSLFTGRVREGHGADIIVIATTALPNVDAVLIFPNAYIALENPNYF